MKSKVAAVLALMMIGTLLAGIAHALDAREGDISAAETRVQRLRMEGM